MFPIESSVPIRRVVLCQVWGVWESRYRDRRLKR
jgi:hypothetical protein